MKITEKYVVETKKIPTRPGCWDVLDVTIFQVQEDGTKKEIGKYGRDYTSLLNTFLPFLSGGKEYALYSENYMATSLMELPSCKKIAGEDPTKAPGGEGFCPADYFVPYEPESGLTGQWGLVAGCIWGDDWSYKVQFLDFSQLDKGIFTRTEKFGYFPIPRDLALKDAVDLTNFYIGTIDGKPYDEQDVMLVPYPIQFDVRKDYSRTDWSDLTPKIWPVASKDPLLPFPEVP